MSKDKKCRHKGCVNGVWVAENGNMMDCPTCKKAKRGVHIDEDYDPTPYCAYCYAMESKNCHCGPRAEND